MTVLRRFTRPFRMGLSRTLWRWGKPLRKPPAPIADIQAKIAAATRSHKPRAALIKQRRELVHTMLRENLR